MSSLSTDPHNWPATPGGTRAPASNNPLVLGVSWLVVGVPLAYGVVQTLVKAAKLFTG